MATTITADQVKKLRDQTGAGMMECKGALTEANGDFEEANTILRKRGLASAAKKAGRTASEGLIAHRVAGDHSAETLVAAKIATLGENMAVSRFVRYAGKGYVGQYIHMGGKIGVQVELAGATP